MTRKDSDRQPNQPPSYPRPTPYRAAAEPTASPERLSGYDGSLWQGGDRGDDPAASPTHTLLEQELAHLHQELQEHQRIETQLRARLALFHQIAETTHQGFFIQSADLTRYLYISAPCEQLWECSRSRLQQQPDLWIQALPTSERAKVLAAQSQQLQGNPTQIEYAARRSDGSCRWLCLRTQPVHSETGQLLHHIGLVEDISDRKQREAQLQQQAEGEALLHTLTQHIASLPLQDFLDQTVAETRRVLQVDRVLVYRLDGDGGGTVIAESVAPGWLPLWGQHILDPCFPQGYQPTTVSAKADIYAEAVHPCYVDFLTRLQVRATLVDSILQGDTLWGLLIVHHCSDSRPWQAWETTLLHQLVLQVGLAVQQHYLQQQTQQQAQQAQALNRIVQATRGALALKTIFATVAVEIAQLAQLDRVDIVQYLPQKQLWRNVASYRRTQALPSALSWEVPDAEQEIMAALKRFEPVQIADSTQVPAMVSWQAGHAFSGACLVVPLSSGSDLWGGLSLLRTASHVWQATELELATQVADHLAIAIQRCELYHQVHQLNTALERQTHTGTAQLHLAFYFESILKRITDEVRDSLNEEQILQSVVQELGAALQVKCCDTALFNPERTLATICYDYTTSMPSAKGQVIPISILATEHEQLFRRQHFQFCLLPNRIRPARPGLYESAILACPIADDQEVLGDLWLFKPADETFNDLEVRLVQQVANQCAIALRQARLYQAVQTQLQELERLNRLKDDFLGAVSHELRSPMSNIRMATQMLEISLQRMGLLEEGLTSPLQQYFHILKEECHRETNLINDLLDLARVDARSEPLELTELDLQTWLPYISEPFLHRAQEQQQQLILDLAPDLPLVNTEQTYLERMVTELLHNACKYTPAGETITLAAQVSPAETVAAETAGAKTTGAEIAGAETAPAAVQSPPTPTLQISIRNTGIEIPASEQARVFEKFYRIPHHDPWKHGGTGLGLALVKKLAEQLGGTIALESRDRATTFTLHLPLLT